VKPFSREAAFSKNRTGQDHGLVNGIVQAALPENGEQNVAGRLPIGAVNRLRTRPDWLRDRFSRPIQDVARHSTPHAEFGIRAARFAVR
jgi:hypothetical protein